MGVEDALREGRESTGSMRRKQEILEPEGVNGVGGKEEEEGIWGRVTITKGLVKWRPTPAELSKINTHAKTVKRSHPIMRDEERAPQQYRQPGTSR